MPTLSIITINRNNAGGLRRTVESVSQQTCRDIEFLIVDGASTDDSMSVVAELLDLHQSAQNKGSKNVDGISISWLSEPDTGIYNAMNKGILMSSGEYLLFLNSGDYLCDEKSIERIIPYFGQADIVHGNIFEDHVGGRIVRGYGRSDISLVDVYRGNFMHQASFFRRTLFDTYGLYDEKLKAGGDTFYYFKVLGMGFATFLYVDVNVTVFELGGISSKPSSYWCEVIAKEDKLYDEQVPPRILQMVKTDSKKYDLYDILHRYPIIWKFTMLLKVIAQKIDSFRRK